MTENLGESQIIHPSLERKVMNSCGLYIYLYVPVALIVCISKIGNHTLYAFKDFYVFFF